MILFFKNNTITNHN